MDNANNQQPLLPVKIEPILALVQERVPKMIRARDGAVAAMTTFTAKFSDAMQKYIADPEGMKDTMEDLVAEGSALLVKVKKTYDTISPWRKEMTEPLDQIKEYLMQYEKDISYDGKTKNAYNDIRALIQQFKQAELDARKKAEAEMARRREIENYKVDLSTAIKKNLADLMVNKVENVGPQSRGYFEESTLENFDTRAATYMSMKWKLKAEDYEKCFTVFFDKTKISDADFKSLVEQAKKEEPYEKWNSDILQEITPIINEWRAKIPDIKRQKQEMAKADDEEKKRLSEEKARQDQAEDERRKMEADRLKRENQQKIDQAADVARMGNSFAEQAQLQLMDETGPAKKVLKFSDDVGLRGQAFMEIVYHVMMHPKCPGLFKKGKTDEYNDAFGWFIRFFETNCKERTVKGAEWTEQAKVIIRK